MRGRRKTKPPVAELTEWERIERIFTNVSGIRPSKLWLSGLSERVGPSRVSRLLSKREAKALDAVIAGVSMPDLRRLRAMGRINFEQAQGAFRLTVFSNVTILVALLAISNQVAPGWIADVWQAADQRQRTTHIMGLIAGIAVSAGITLYAYGGVTSARDLNHLLDLHLVGMEDGDLDTLPAATEPADPVEDLRAMQLSDI